MYYYIDFHKMNYCNMKYSAIFILVLFLVNNSLIAGAWLQGKNKGYSQFGFSYLHYNKMFYNAKAYNMPRSVTDITYQWYQEYGLSNDFDLISVIPLKSVSNGEPNDLFDFSSISKFPNQFSLFGPGNIELGIKYSLKEKKTMQSLVLKWVMPTAIKDENSGLNTGYDGSGIYGAYLLGKGWNKSYFSGELGMCYRTNGFSNDLSVLLEYGRKLKFLNNDLWMVFVMNILQPTNKGNYENGNRYYSGLYASNIRFYSPGLKLNYNITDKFWLNVSSFGALNANLGGKAPIINISIAYNW